MSASFQCAGEHFYGTNGLIDACLECFTKVATAEYGSTDPIAVLCREEREKAYPGMLVCLDPLLYSEEGSRRLASVVAKSEAPLIRDYQLNEVGVAWVLQELPRLIAATTPKKPNQSPEPMPLKRHGSA